jgi:hypothetical protein
MYRDFHLLDNDAAEAFYREIAAEAVDRAEAAPDRFVALPRASRGLCSVAIDWVVVGPDADGHRDATSRVYRAWQVDHNNPRHYADEAEAEAVAAALNLGLAALARRCEARAKELGS